MWYRRVGGVVGKAQLKNDSRVRSSGLSDNEEESQSNTNAPSPDEESPANSFVAPSNQRELDGNASNLFPEVIATATVDSHLAPGQDFGQVLHQRPMGDVTDTLFFDVSATMEDLPDGLEWFFEMPQHGIVANDGLVGSATAPLLHTEPVIFESPLFSQNAALVSPPTANSAWSVVRPKLLMSLSALPPDVLESIFFHPCNLEFCFDLYFEKYHNHFPFLHRPTLSITESPPLLIIAIVTLGSTLATDETIFRIGQRIHDALRWIVFSSGQFEPPAPLWCLQALLLIQAQGKMFSTAKHHEMAHIFHGAILTMMQRGRAPYTTPVPKNSHCSSIRSSWRQWAEDESTRRTSFFAFIMDAQHASVFGHNPVLSVSDVRLPLPCSETLWECSSPESWKEALQHSPKPLQFLPTLKALLGRSLVPSTCSHFSRFILLHGLLSLTTHLLARDCTTLGIERGKVGNRATATPIAQVEDWKDIMSTAINCWSYSLYTLQPSLCLEAAQSIHRVAYITLYTNIADIHVFAKNPILLENHLLRKQYIKAEGRLHSWSKTAEARKAVIHSLLMVKETMFSRRHYRAREDNIAPRPWCLFQAILVLWTFGVMAGGPADEANTILGAEEYVVQVMSSLQNGNSTIMGVNKTKGLLLAMREALEGARWALLQEAYVTLGTLIDTTTTTPRLHDKSGGS